MQDSTITMIIIACTCVLYLTEKFSVAVTAVLGMMALVAGYRFKDYFRLGGLVGIIGLATAWLGILLQFGLL